MFSTSINLSNFTKLELIGEGGFANVYKIEDKLTKMIYAAKVLNKKFQSSDNDIKLLKREVMNMVKLQHPAITRFFGLSPTDFDGDFKPTLVIEYLPNNSLQYILGKEELGLSPDGWDITKKMINIYGIASAINYLHKNKIIHRDLKTENILLDEHIFPKIADFGLSKDTDESSKSMVNILGTPKYIAPEVWNQEPYTYKCDIYAFAYIMYETLATKTAFKNYNINKLMVEVIIGRNRPEMDSTVPQAFQNLIKRCWSHNPDDRPDSEEILNLLENDDSFLVDSVETNDYYRYIDLVHKCQSPIDSTSQSMSVEQYMIQNSISFAKFNIMTKQTLNEIISYQKMKSKEEEEEERKEEEEDQNQKTNDKLIQQNQKTDDKLIQQNQKTDDKLIQQNQNQKTNDKLIQQNQKTNDKSNKQNDKNVDNSDSISLKKLADNGDVNSMFLYAICCYKGLETPVNKKEASIYFRRAADLGHIKSAMNIAYMLYKGDGIDADMNTSADYYRMAAERGDLDAMNNYAIMICNGYAVEKNMKEAARLFKEASDKGNLNAMNNYGNALYGGKGVPMNKKKAIEYFKKAADLGNADAMNTYANLLLIGEDVPKDKNLAFEYFEKAADIGNLFAAYNYAIMLEKGDIVQVDREEIKRYLNISSKKGCSLASYRLGKYLLEEKKNDEADVYLKKAADLNHLDAAFYYGKSLFLKDKKEGLEYLEGSCAIKNKKTNVFLFLNKMKESSCNIC